MSFSLPKRATAYTTYIGLTSQATGLLQANPTLAAGDFKVVQDDGSLVDLGTLPTLSPAGSRRVKITLSAAEMTGDNITVQCVDAAGAEWADQLINIQPTVNQVDDLFATALADSIPTDGTRPSASQALYMLAQFMTERSVAGTTITVKKVDGTTTLMTFTLNSATTPTSITRTT